MDPADPHANVGPQLLLGSFVAQQTTGLHALIRSARSGDPVAVHEVLARVRRAGPARWRGLRSAVLVVVPGHVPDARQPLLEAVAETLIGMRGWQSAPDGLVRTSVAPEAKSSRWRDPQGEASTLEWRHPCPTASTIVLLDDVFRTGGTFDAARHAIVDAADTRPVLLLAVAAAITDP